MAVRTSTIARVALPEMKLAHQFCRGSGVELGAAAHNPFGLPGAINVAPYSSDPSHPFYDEFEFYKQCQEDLCGAYAEVDLPGTAGDIPVPDRSQDYVVSSHVIEHVANVLQAFLEWNRVLRPGGVVLMIFPHRDAEPMDRLRELTPLQHFVDDYRRGETQETDPPPQIADENGVHRLCHYHVFTLRSMLELIEWGNRHLNLGWRILKTEENDSKVGNGSTVVARYEPPAESAGLADEETVGATTSRGLPLLSPLRVLRLTSGRDAGLEHIDEALVALDVDGAVRYRCIDGDGAPWPDVQRAARWAHVVLFGRSDSPAVDLARQLGPAAIDLMDSGLPFSGQLRDDLTPTQALEVVKQQALRVVSLSAIERLRAGGRESRPRVLVIGFDRVTTTHIAALQPCRELEQQGLIEVAWREPELVTPRDVRWADAVYVVRAVEIVQRSVLEWIDRARTPLIFAWDDDFFSLPTDMAGTPLARYYGHPRLRRDLERILTEASLVTATTPSLVARSRAFNSNVMVQTYGLRPPDCEPPAQPGAPERLAGRVRIGFFGSNGHLEDSFIVAALQELRDRFQDRIVLEAIVVSEPSARVRGLLDWCSARQLPYDPSLCLLRERQWDIGLAPLPDTEFNAAKSATKFRDYAWCGAAMVASDVPSYRRDIVDGVHGLLVVNQPSAWVEAVSALIEDPNRRSRLAAEARRVLDAIYLQDRVLGNWYQLLWRIVASQSRAARLDPPPRYAWVYDDLICPVTSACYTVRKRGRSLLSASRRVVGAVAGSVARGEFPNVPWVLSQAVVEDAADHQQLAPRRSARLRTRLAYRVTARQAGWHGLDVLVGTHQQPAAGTLTLRISTPSGSTLREAAVDLELATDNSWLSFDFSPIDDAGGHSFVAEFILSAAGPDTRISLYETGEPMGRLARACLRLLGLVGFRPLGTSLCCAMRYRRGRDFDYSV